MSTEYQLRGTPEQIIKNKESYTAKYLEEEMINK